MSLIDALAGFSAGLGADPLLVQGPGGNTSIKLGGVLHVKASGLWLARATVGSFVALELGAVRGRLAGAEGEPELGDLVVGCAGMRPSIETGMHAVMPHRVVVHTHSVNAIAHLVRRDAAAALGPLLAGVRWCFVPYARPGMPLLRAIEAAGGVGADVLMLGNHGVVVGADDLEGAGRLVAEVERRLAVVARAAGAGAALPEWAGWRGAVHAESHGLGVDEVSRALASVGAFYPDHVVFLGPGGVRSVRSLGEHHPPPPPSWKGGEKVVLVAGAGAMVREGVTAAEEEMVRCLAMVLARVEESAPVRVLDAEEEAALMGWDAEAFRRGLDARRLDGAA